MVRFEIGDLMKLSQAYSTEKYMPLPHFVTRHRTFHLFFYIAHMLNGLATVSLLWLSGRAFGLEIGKAEVFLLLLSDLDYFPFWFFILILVF